MSESALALTKDVYAAATQRHLTVVDGPIDPWLRELPPVERSPATYREEQADRLRSVAGQEILRVRIEAEEGRMPLHERSFKQTQSLVALWALHEASFEQPHEKPQWELCVAKPGRDRMEATTSPPRLRIVGRSEARPSGTPKAKSASGGDDSGGSDGPPLPLPSVPCLIGAAATRITTTKSASAFTFCRLAEILEDWPASWRLAVFHALPDRYRSACWDSLRVDCDADPERRIGGVA
ncbi:MAG: hypothetical protein JHD16_00680 [Solirubrobacteraceae bacterium]|nr:hypothetical protein [Solirubrobacteraceae bacterium]